jgi:hypothetical protein
MHVTDAQGSVVSRSLYQNKSLPVVCLFINSVRHVDPSYGHSQADVMTIKVMVRCTLHTADQRISQSLTLACSWADVTSYQ